MKTYQSNKNLILAISIPVVYGILMRIFFGINMFDYFSGVMSLSFLVLVPLGIGALSIWFSSPENRRSSRYAFFFPWLVCIVLMVMTIAISLEGWICWVMIYPFFAFVAGIGGLLIQKWIVNKEKTKNTDPNDDNFKTGGTLQISLLFLLPLAIAFLEKQWMNPAAIFEKHNSIELYAPVERIWANVTRVYEITPEEDHAKLNHWMGIPRPLYAKLDTLALGGIREAVFEGGLIFHEKVYEYQHENRMSFSIKANPHEIPATTMDEHIVIGGDYFDVLDGTYALETLGKDHYRLHLSSRFTLKTHFNWYAGWWAQRIMGDIQGNILEVLKGRVSS
jgi:hypothetical protein